MFALGKRGIDCAVGKTGDRSSEFDRAHGADNIDLGRSELPIALVLVSFAFVDGMTKRARVRAVKCLRNCLPKWRAL